MGDILAPLPTESPVRVLHLLGVELSNDTPSLAQLQVEALPCAHVQKGGNLCL